METWRKMERQDTLAVYTMMRGFYERCLGAEHLRDDLLWETIDRCVSSYPYLEGWLILAEDQTIAGYAMLSRGYDPMEAKEYMRLEEFFILPSCRMNGLGQAFLRQLSELYPACSGVTIQTAVSDRKSQRLYASLGYHSLAHTMISKTRN